MSKELTGNELSTGLTRTPGNAGGLETLRAGSSGTAGKLAKFFGLALAATACGEDKDPACDFARSTVEIVDGDCEIQDCKDPEFEVVGDCTFNVDLGNKALSRPMIKMTDGYFRFNVHERVGALLEGSCNIHRSSLATAEPPAQDLGFPKYSPRWELLNCSRAKSN